MLQEFDLLVRQRKELKAWWDLGTTIAAYNKNYHTLRTVVTNPQIDFCGQQYAGARNYHSAPDFFIEAVRQEIGEQSRQIVSKAYQKELDRINAEIEKHREEVLKQLNIVDEKCPR